MKEELLSLLLSPQEGILLVPLVGQVVSCEQLRQMAGETPLLKSQPGRKVGWTNAYKTNMYSSVSFRTICKGSKSGTTPCYPFRGG